MKPTVMTTGPGVIIATATASRNCCSFSQPYSFTTPLYKNGTIASPLPNTKAPAFAKNKPSAVSFVDVVVILTCASKPVMGSEIPLVVRVRGLTPTFTNQTSTPAHRNTQIFSSSVQMVKPADRAKMAHSNRSCPNDLLASL